MAGITYEERATGEAGQQQRCQSPQTGGLSKREVFTASWLVVLKQYVRSLQWLIFNIPGRNIKQFVFFFS
jgi:hypothetical protein